MRLALIPLLVAALPATAEQACKSELPDDLQLICVDGVATAVSESARQYMQFPKWRCRAGMPTGL